MTFAFVTSLRHPQNSADYDRVESLLADTLASVCAQTDDDFVVIVVGNRRPRFELDDHVRFVQVDFAAPAPPTGAQTAREPFVRDKGSKIAIGLIAAQQYEPEYAMVFDADDFVHRSIVEFASRRPHRGGWVVADGWMYSRARGVVRRQPEFNRTCGTCFIVPFTAYGVPDGLTVSATQDEIIAAFGDRLPRILGAHRDAEAWFAEHGEPLQPLPFRGAVYQVDTGENHSGKGLVGVAWPLTARTASVYGVRRSRTGPRAALTSLEPDNLRFALQDLRGRIAWRAAALRRRDHA